MKVLHLISSGGMYGAETMLLNLASAQQLAGCKPILGVFANEHAPHVEIAEEARNRKIPVEVFKCKSRFDPKAMKAIRKFVKENGVNLVHGHGYKSDLYGYLAVRPLSVPFVATCHSTPMATENSLSVRFYEFIDSRILRRAQRVACVSEMTANALRKSGVPSEKLSTIPNGTDMERFAGAAPTLRSELAIGNRPLIGTVGRLEEIKGLDYFIRAAQETLVEFPDAMFVIVGEGPQHAHLKTLIQSLGLESNIQLTGRRDDMPGVYASLDIFVLASIDEGMPMTILEAMASRRPVIATRVGGTSEVVLDGETGYLVEPRDVHALRDGMLKWLRDPSLARKMGSKGEEHVRISFSSEGMAQCYFELYRQVIRGQESKSAASLQEV